MGYTHYFRQLKAVRPAAWKRIMADTQRLLQATDIPVSGDYYRPEVPPEVNKDLIQFNGMGEDGHETFYITRDLNPDFNFCKTARKPYDLLVCAVLTVIDHHAPQAFDIASDGNYAGYGGSEWQGSEWTPAIEFVERVLGPGYQCPRGVTPAEEVQA